MTKSINTNDLEELDEEVEVIEDEKDEEENKSCGTPGVKKQEAIVLLLLAFIFAIIALITGIINSGITTYIMGVCAIVFIVVFFMQIKNIYISQKDLNAWHEEIKTKHPNSIAAKTPLKFEDFKGSILNKFSYWSHTLKQPVIKVAVCVILPLTMVAAILGMVIPAFGGGIGGSKVSGVYIIDTSYGSSRNMEYVVVTALEFNSDGSLRQGAMDLETNRTSWYSTGTFTQSGNTITVSLKGETLILNVKDNGKTLVSSDGRSRFKKYS